MATYFPPASSSCSLSRRPSRGAESHRAMRVVKPSSAASSPQSSWNSNRRRTMMNDTSSAWRTQQILEQLLASGQNQPEPSPRSVSGVNRPVSWHPDSFGQYGVSQCPDTHQYQQPPHQYPQHWKETSPPSLQQSPITASAATSPTSAVSPLPPAYYGFPSANSHYLSPGAWQTLQSTTPYYSSPMEQPGYTEPFPTMDGMNWTSHTAPVSTATTTPPTPDVVFQHGSGIPATTQASPQFQTLDEPEEEDGEVLVGMGLYDAPDKSETSQLSNYRSAVSSLLGSQFRASEVEGKGLKLEETWAPPPQSDEDEETSDHEDEDAQ